jgi:hypothetical protein
MVPLTRKRSAAAAPPDSPETKKTKKLQDRISQKRALNEFLRLRNANGGTKLKRGEIKALILRQRMKGFTAVSRRNLRYRLDLLKQGKPSLATEIEKPSDEVEVEANSSGVSSMTSAPNNQSSDNEAVATVVGYEITNEYSDSEEESVVNQTGRPKDTTNKHKKQYSQNVIDATNQVCLSYKQVKEAARSMGEKCSNGTLEQLIESAEIKYGLKKGDIKPGLVSSRVKRNKLSGKRHQQISPLADIEPLIVEWCLRMARIGMALTKSNVVALATDLIAGTVHARKLKRFKKKKN